MRQTMAKKHMAVNIQGFLENYRRRSMKGLIINDDGTPMTDSEARNYLYDHLRQGHTLLPMCNEKECPDFDYFGGGCPGHDIHYYDDNNNEISKEEWDAKLEAMRKENEK